jgi:NADH-quinone oxidoreductase subunit J
VTAADIVIAALGVVAVGSGVMVVTTRQLVHAALWLVVSFGALAASYVVLAAEFVAWVQVLIYVGAIVVLLLFGIMLTRAPIGRSDDLDSGNRIVALVVAVATAAVLVTTLVRGFRDAYFPLKARVGSGSSATVGASLFRYWVLPFEALSVLLLAALIGAVVLSRSDIGPERPKEDAADAEDPKPPKRPRPRPGVALARRRPRNADDEDTIVLSRIDEDVV